MNPYTSQAIDNFSMSKGTRATSNVKISSQMQTSSRNVANLFNSMQVNKIRNESGLSTGKTAGPHQYLHPQSRQYNPLNSTKDLGELRNKRVSEMTSSDRPIDSSMGKWQDMSEGAAGFRANSRIKPDSKVHSNIDMTYVMNQSNTLEERKKREQHLGIISVDAAYNIVNSVQ